MDEQVVPTFNVVDNDNPFVPLQSSAGKGALSKSHNPRKVHIRSVPHPSSSKTASATKSTVSSSTTTTALSLGTTTTNDLSPKATPVTFKKYQKDDQTLPPSEYRGKLRWQTPTRTGKWREPWNSAVQLCPLPLHSPVSLQPSISTILRSTLTKAIVTYVGPLLPPATVNKWLCLLCEYLELSTDEEILVTCLLRRYSKLGGNFITANDWVRPQKWECVIAIACYLAVLLTEEFPGRTALDLKELLGTGFKFGSEQVSFLKCVDWKICIDTDEINDVLDCCTRCVNGDLKAYSEMDQWFSAQTRDVSDAKLWDSGVKERQAVVSTKKEVKSTPQGQKDTVAKSAKNANVEHTNNKKRPFASIAAGGAQEDSVVPPYVIRRIDPAVNTGGGLVYHQHVPIDPSGQNYMIPTMGQNGLPAFIPAGVAGGHNGVMAVHAAAAAAAAAGIPTVPMWTAGPGAGW